MPDKRRPRAGAAPADPLARLVVLDRLEVGPVKVGPRRLSVPYRVVRGSHTSATELAYTWPETVFDPEEPASRNLAALIGAQVALNYGLFAERIVFRGDFDAADRRFLDEMARNTAREIYVKKLLEPNPFLVGDAVGIPVVKRASYLKARLVFPDDPPPPAPPWNVERSRVAVLSSGGKDSLLSYGLLAEMGFETHPLFVNESGRHWYTALNAHRYLDRHVPRTARVWTSADRVFAWMLRELPFIRRDFADVRCDEYPIRLWTVAVFAFGVLPLVRKRGIGRLVIGDEYDTSRRLAYQGIPHHNGLYDQSRWFDNALTRYYRLKGFSVSQFSILRPLSELLIQKVLVKRYPELQAQQVSCHAAHTREGRVLPCGKCEKCRRIVGMLKALDADPGACGYTERQVEECLKALADLGVHQEHEGAQQVAWMLAAKGLLGGGGAEARAGSVEARERPEVLKLRFDPERSPMDAIPRDLRAPLYRILLSHAEGAVRRSGRVWVPCQPLTDPDLSRPYPFEGGAAGPSSRRRPPARTRGGAGPAREHLLGELTWTEARQRFRETDTALLPVGAIEQHGPHLPLDTDAWDAEHLARLVAERVSTPRPLVLPLIPYGVSYQHEDFAGTLSVSPETLARLVYEVGLSAARQGITKLVIVNGHGGNLPTLQFAAQMINRDAHIFTCVDTGETSDADIRSLTETPGDVHAGEVETSTTLATRPELVKLEHAQPFVPEFSSQYLNFSSLRSVEWNVRTARISPSGVLGDPTRASREKGERIWELMIARLAELVELLKGLSLDELHRRRG